MRSKLDFSVINGKGYIKNLFRNLNLSPNSQVSIFGWDRNAESPWHDHSVEEITFVFKGKLEQVCRLPDGKLVVTTHEAGTYFTVPVDTLHKVRAIEESITVNICDGDLQMKTFQEEVLFETASKA